MTGCLLAWPGDLGLASQDRQGWGLLTRIYWIKPDKARFDLMNTKCESWGEFYSEFVLRF